MDTHKEVTVKMLLDSRAMGIFADKKFIKKNGFKLEKLDRPSVRQLAVNSNSTRIKETYRET